MSKKNDAEKRRLTRLKKDIDQQQKKLDKDKTKFQAQKTNFIKQQKAFEIEKKAFQAAKNQFEKQKRKAKGTGNNYGIMKSQKGAGGIGHTKLRKAEADLKETKDKLDKRSKEVRELRKETDNLKAEIDILKRQLKKAGRIKAAPDNSRKIKQLKREMANLRKRLRKSLRDLEKQSRYYNSQLKRFKDDQNKWLRKQRDLAKNKKIHVKYVFIDDIKSLKVYRKDKRRIRVKTREGGEVVVRDVDVIDASEIEEAADDEIDVEIEKIEKEFKPRKKKTRRRTIKNDEGKLIEIEEEVDDDDDDDDDNKDDELPEDNVEEIYDSLIIELNSRSRDLGNINRIYAHETGDDVDKSLKELLDNVIERYKTWTAKLKELFFENCDELPEIIKKWQDEIYKLREIVEKRRLKRIKEMSELETRITETNNNKDDEKDNKYLVTAKDELLRELSGRIEDLSELNNIYFHNDDSEFDKNKNVRELKKSINLRHNKIENILNDIQNDNIDNDINEIFPENNIAWQNLINETCDVNIKNNTAPLKNELKQRTKELDKVIQVLNNEKPKTALNTLINSIDIRHNRMKNHKTKNDDDYKGDDDDDKENNEWLELIKTLSNKKPKKDIAHVKENSMKDYIIKNLLNEMDKRKKDLDTLKELTNNDDIPEEEFENIKESAIERHLQQKKDIKQALNNKFKNNKEKTSQQIIDAIENDNSVWQNQLKKLSEEARNNKNLKNRNKYYLDELEGRITDLIKIEDIYDKSIADGKLNEAKDSLKSLVSNVNDRHNTTESEMKEELKKSTNKRNNLKALETYSQNDDDWRDAIGQITTKITEKPQKNYNTAIPVTSEPEPQEPEIKDDEYDPNEEVQSVWWLDKDAQRQKKVDTIKVDDKQKKKLVNIADYMEKILSANFEDPIIPLYQPLPKKDNHHILSTFYDGYALLQLMNSIKPGFIDMRAVDKPDPFDPKPVSDKEVEENINLVLSGVRGLGINLNQNRCTVNHWTNPNRNAHMLAEIVNKLHDKKIDEMINVENDNSLIRLAKSDEEKDDVDKIAGATWLNRWMNNANENKLDDDIKDQNDALYKTMNKVTNGDFKNIDKDFNTNQKKNSKNMIDYGNNKLGITTEYENDDIGKGNIMVDELFAAEVYQAKSGLKPLSIDEKKKYKSYLTKENAAENSFESWINSLLPAQFHIANLYRGLSDGVVLCRMLDKLQPGCIDWKKKVKLTCSNKFQKLNNCDYALGVCKKYFTTISLVSVDASHIVNSNQKFIYTILWQLMRYHATKKLSELSFGGKDVKDEDIIQWANLTIDDYENKQSKKLKSLRDKTLTTCVFYSELLKAIDDNSVETKYINYDVYPLKNNRTPDKYRKERLDNARYAMTCCRKLGGDLFIMPETLAAMDQKAVLSMLASIMTIAFTDKDKRKTNNLNTNADINDALNAQSKLI